MRRSRRSAENELMIDHRAGPGVPPEIAAWAGIDPKLVEAGQLAEMPTITCNHCQYVVIVNPNRERDRERCQYCDEYICDDCAKVVHLTLSCDAMIKRLDRYFDDLAHGSTSLLLTSTIKE